MHIKFRGILVEYAPVDELRVGTELNQIDVVQHHAHTAQHRPGDDKEQRPRDQDKYAGIVSSHLLGEQQPHARI
ncbi:hypothetical protein [Pseudoalteromonas sp. OOF1S-7]|uniref:hypothetical protein n=1 Tax=Pseudoalteromonas sp. OOF1S-7 TaxID=2917757 RepID=UPI001EF54A4C|nr:hypothetical protein [Pseudoalteromonas sp. OOF1S-7]MCG7537941.1 hypothetical protein [Pseudoalteromonas sp. OOF1S-7]